MSLVFEYCVRTLAGVELVGSVMLAEPLTLEEARCSTDVLRQLTEAAGENHKLLELRMPACSGCQENQPNQQAHMEYGGCMYSEE